MVQVEDTDLVYKVLGEKCSAKVFKHLKARLQTSRRLPADPCELMWDFLNEPLAEAS